MATTHPKPGQVMIPFRVTVRDARGRRQHYARIARCWYEAFEQAVNEFGLASFCSVIPYKRPAK
jgi:cyclopropane fatty-acyl-phospholipid synthase-like methyltransferase